MSSFLIGLFLSVCAQVEPVKQGDYYAFSRSGEVFTPYHYTEVSAFREGIAWVNKGALYGYVDTNLNAVTPFVYTDVAGFSEGFAAVSRDSAFGFINNKGLEICALQYHRVLNFHKGFAAILDSAGWNLLDSFGKEVFEDSFDHPPRVVSSRFIVVSRKGKWGVMNSRQQVVYPLKYDFISADGVAYLNEEKEYLGLL